VGYFAAGEAFLSGEAALTAFLSAFEDGTWPGADFRHAHHLAVAVCYLFEEPDPMDRLRDRIRAYNVSQGGENTEDRGYHETITRFWLETVIAYRESLPAGLSRLETARRVVEEFAPRRDLFRDCYEFDVLKSREARKRWIPPGSIADLQTPG
jgi:hypothetical protein